MAEETTTTEVTETTTEDDTGLDDLGDAGKRAIAAERDRARKAERTAKATARDMQRLQAELEELRNAGASEAEKAIAQARKEAKAEARKEALSEANARLARAEFKVAAAGVLADPADAVRFLDPADFTVDDDGGLDAKAVKKALADLIEERPYLAVVDGKPRGSGDGGPRRTVESGGDMNNLIRRAAGRA